MSKTKADYAKMNAKMTGAKGSVSRYCNAMGKLCIKLEELLNREEKDFSDKTAKKIAKDMDKTRESIEKHLENLENTAEDTKVKDIEKMAAMVNDDIEDYISKYDKLKTEHAQTIEAA